MSAVPPSELPPVAPSPPPSSPPPSPPRRRLPSPPSSTRPLGMHSPPSSPPRRRIHSPPRESLNSPPASSPPSSASTSPPRSPDQADDVISPRSNPSSQPFWKRPGAAGEKMSPISSPSMSPRPSRHQAGVNTPTPPSVPPPTLLSSPSTPSLTPTPPASRPPTVPAVVPSPSQHRSRFITSGGINARRPHEIPTAPTHNSQGRAQLKKVFFTHSSSSPASQIHQSPTSGSGLSTQLPPTVPVLSWLRMLKSCSSNCQTIAKSLRTLTSSPGCALTPVHFLLFSHNYQLSLIFINFFLTFQGNESNDAANLCSGHSASESDPVLTSSSSFPAPSHLQNAHSLRCPREY